MVNLESQNLMQLSDFSVLHEIFHPASSTLSSTASIDPKLVLATKSSVSSFPSPDRKDVTSSPAPVPLSVHELESRVETKPEIAQLETVTPTSHGHETPAGGKSSPIDIVHLAAEEIRKPILKLRDESKVKPSSDLSKANCQVGKAVFASMIASRV